MPSHSLLGAVLKKQTGVIVFLMSEQSREAGLRAYRLADWLAG